MKLIKVKCKNCGKVFLKYKRHYKENLSLGHNFYCSKKCESRYKTKKQSLACENCGKQFLRTPNDILRHNYCSQSCAATVNNRKYPKRKPRLKTCLYCHKQFRKSAGNFKYCSTKCRGGAKPNHTLQELIDIIRTKTQELRRVPARREMKESDSCRKFFGSWNNAIIAAGLQPNRSHNQRMYKRANAKSLDGHLCDSISELLIDNWLTKKEIPHERNASYPQTNHKADWIVNFKRQTIFIEYFGLSKDSPRYDRSIVKKKILCSQYKIKLVEIYPWDLYPKIKLDAKLNFLS